MAARLLDSMSSSSTLSSSFTAASSLTSASADSSSSSSSSSSSAASGPQNPDQASVTPARKHRKMLKDGSSEVWPEYLERIFVQGLEAYWKSPWATYTKGRSRWRNQFLVDYLHNAGIERSKKQVASHIQVLRNMWKGQKEYELVASADEILQHTVSGRAVAGSSGTHRPHKDRARKHVRARSQTHSDDAEPESPIDVKEEPAEDGLLALPDGHAFPILGIRSDEHELEHEAMKPDMTSSPELSTAGPLSPFAALSPAETTMTSPTLSTLTIGDCHFPPQQHTRGRAYSMLNTPMHVLSSPTIAIPTTPACQLTALTLWAEGMHPVTFDIAGQLFPGAPLGARAALRVQLSASSLSDVTSPPTMHGFQGTATFSGRWLRAATCVTRVIVDGVCDSQEMGAFDALPSASPSAQVQLSSPGFTALLPDSWLSRCRWRNAAVPTRLTQQIFVDGSEIATIVYDLLRPETGCASATLVGWSLEPPRPRASSSERASPMYTWGPHTRPALQPRAQTMSFTDPGPYSFPLSAHAPTTLFS